MYNKYNFGNWWGLAFTILICFIVSQFAKKFAKKYGEKE